jgi:hypothetical protein
MIPMADLLAEWDNLTNSNDFSSFAGESWLKFHATGEFVNLAKTHAELYIGNIKVQPSLSSLGIVKETPETAKLVETKEIGESFDLTSLLSIAKNKEILAEYANQTSWTIVNNGTGVAVSVTGNKVDVSTFARGVYKVSAMLGDVAVYEGEIDIYDEDVFEWFDFASVKAGAYSMKEKYGTHYDLGGVGVGANQAAWKWGTVTVGTATAETDDNLATAGANGQYVKVSYENSNEAYYKCFALKPLHSKTYYERYADKNFTFAFVTTLAMDTPNGGKGYINTTTHGWNGIAANSKITASVSISALLADWDNVAAGKHYFFNSAHRASNEAVAYYIGEFTLVNV